MKEELRETIVCMCEFVRRASKEEATSEEVAVLPEVANAITNMVGVRFKESD